MNEIEDFLVVNVRKWLQVDDTLRKKLVFTKDQLFIVLQVAYAQLLDTGAWAFSSKTFIFLILFFFIWFYARIGETFCKTLKPRARRLQHFRERTLGMKDRVFYASIFSEDDLVAQNKQ